MAEIRYTIKTAPITKKNSQQILTNRKTGRAFIAPSARYKKYEREAAGYLNPRPPRPIECPINVKCLFFMPTRRLVDLTNLLEAVDDVLVNEGIIKDDNSRIVVAHDGSRVLYDKDNARTEIYITKIIPENEQISMF